MFRIFSIFAIVGFVLAHLSCKKDESESKIDYFEGYECIDTFVDEAVSEEKIPILFRYFTEVDEDGNNLINNRYEGICDSSEDFLGIFQTVYGDAGVDFCCSNFADSESSEDRYYFFASYSVSKKQLKTDAFYYLSGREDEDIITTTTTSCTYFKEERFSILSTDADEVDNCD